MVIGKVKAHDIDGKHAYAEDNNHLGDGGRGNKAFHFHQLIKEVPVLFVQILFQGNEQAVAGQA